MPGFGFCERFFVENYMLSEAGAYLLKELPVSLVAVENTSLLWFNAAVLRLNAPLVLLAFEMK